MCFHPSVSLNNEKICCAISEDKIAVCEKTAGLRSGNFSDLNSACQKVVVPVKIFQFRNMLDENRFLDTFRGHSKRTNRWAKGVRYVMTSFLLISILWRIIVSDSLEWLTILLCSFPNHDTV